MLLFSADLSLLIPSNWEKPTTKSNWFAIEMGRNSLEWKKIEKEVKESVASTASILKVVT